MTLGGASLTVGPGALIPNDLVHGRSCSVGEHSFVQAGVTLEDDVWIGPRATVLSPSGTPELGQPASLLVRAGAEIGAAAVVCGPSVIERGAKVRPGAVVTSDVPPYAIVEGNPAYLVGYVSQLGGPTQEGPVSQVHIPPQAGPLMLASGARVIRFPEYADLRGLLTFAEVDGLLPFEVRRFFLVYDVPSREVRGEHAHRNLHQLLIAVKGTVSVLTDNGTHRDQIQLDGPTVGLHIPPMVWGAQFRHSPNAVLLVLASDRYDADDYIREYEDFLGLLS